MSNERKCFIGETEVEFMSLKPGDKFILTESWGEFVALCKATANPFVCGGIETIACSVISGRVNGIRVVG